MAGRPEIGLAVAAWTTLILLSTVFVKQHYVADMVGGVLLAFVTSWASLNLLKKSAP